MRANDQSYCNIDGVYNAVNTVYTDKEGIRFRNYVKAKQGRLPMLYQEPWQCCGCTSCFAICPQNAISMEPGKEGFLYPVIDAAKCMGCLKCKEVCVFNPD